MPLSRLGIVRNWECREIVRTSHSVYPFHQLFVHFIHLPIYLKGVGYVKKPWCAATSRKQPKAKTHVQKFYQAGPPQ